MGGTSVWGRTPKNKKNKKKSNLGAELFKSWRYWLEYNEEKWIKLLVKPLGKQGLLHILS